MGTRESIFAPCFTAQRSAHIIENMFVRLRHGHQTAIFNIWFYDDTSQSRGSGLLVGEEGVVAHHFFHQQKNEAGLDVFPGDYKVEVYAILAAKQKLLLSTVPVTITSEQVAAIKSDNSTLVFDWHPDTNTYQSHLTSNKE